MYRRRLLLYIKYSLKSCEVIGLLLSDYIFTESKITSCVLHDCYRSGVYRDCSIFFQWSKWYYVIQEDDWRDWNIEYEHTNAIFDMLWILSFVFEVSYLKRFSSPSFLIALMKNLKMNAFGHVTTLPTFIVRLEYRVILWLFKVFVKKRLLVPIKLYFILLNFR